MLITTTELILVFKHSRLWRLWNKTNISHI